MQKTKTSSYRKYQKDKTQHAHNHYEWLKSIKYDTICTDH